MQNRKPTVLLAEDEAPVRRYLSETLVNNGFIVIEAEDGKEAISICQAEGTRLDAIVSDIRMPNADGAELARYNYDNGFHPFIVCTAIVDAKVALGLLGLGVQDYIVKPVREDHLIATVKNAITRRSMKKYMEDDENPYAGNIGSLTVPSRLSEINRAGKWVENKLRESLAPHEFKIFFSHLHEFLLNAHEHGNLKITEEEKSLFINEDRLMAEIEKRETGNKARIKIDLSVLHDEVAVCITDDGFGFNFQKYLDMPDEELIQRLELPNGRGISMALGYFDSIFYSKGGSSVLLMKKFN